MTDGICTAPGCDKPIRTRRSGLCEMHYFRQRRTGSLEDPRRTPEQRFFARVTKSPNGCWLWDKGPTHGYGHFYAEGHQHFVHRWSYQHFVGPIPEGMTVDHRCHDEASGCPGGPACLHRRCVNPEHLMLATGPENASRGVKTWQTHCKRGHEFTETNTYRVNGRRHCITCRTARKRAWRRRHMRDRPKGETWPP